ncbi:hypothetical protein GOBAR_AA01565 [Gossypium barbadense]|uniref:Uncharacterized protein n=1 Tax=Gossypium barbadense TaxID=3634 RepID=A0A2P5YTV1_GOSBA|nr:hypothetical protein GOBAR_AA01565 [Gossypium barbadense]
MFTFGEVKNNNDGDINYYSGEIRYCCSDKQGTFAKGLESFLRLSKVSSKDDAVQNMEIPKTNLDWIHGCRVGKLKSMYNVSLVQQTVSSDGVACKVCPWRGLTVIVSFDSKDEMVGVLGVKRSLIILSHSILRRSMGWVVLKEVAFILWHEQSLEVG